MPLKYRVIIAELGEPGGPNQIYHQDFETLEVHDLIRSLNTKRIPYHEDLLRKMGGCGQFDGGIAGTTTAHS